MIMRCEDDDDDFTVTAFYITLSDKWWISQVIG